MSGGKLYDVCGVGNGLLDILLEISDEDFAALDLERGTMRLVDDDYQKQLLERFGDHRPVLASGGSIANSIIAVAQLGGTAAFKTCLGDDKYGLHYHGEFEQLGIELGNPLVVGATTGTCLVLITPDAERTMRTNLAVSGLLSDDHIDEEIIKRSKWVFFEGYLLASEEYGQKAVKRSIELAKQHDCKIAFSMSEAFVPQAFAEQTQYVVSNADLVFANEAEAMAFAGVDSLESACDAMREQVPHVVVTAGERGAYIAHSGVVEHVPASKCTPKDLTGAGDMFAGTYLYGLTHGVEPKIAAKAGNFLAKQVISHVGARLHTGVREFWDEVLS